MRQPVSAMRNEQPESHAAGHFLLKLWRMSILPCVAGADKSMRGDHMGIAPLSALSLSTKLYWVITSSASKCLSKEKLYP